jgi:hypothetical protein
MLPFFSCIQTTGRDKDYIFLYVIPRPLVYRDQWLEKPADQCFGEIYCLHHQGRRMSLTKTAGSSEISSLSTKLLGNTSQKTVIFIVTAMRTSVFHILEEMSKNVKTQMQHLAHGHYMAVNL